MIKALQNIMKQDKEKFKVPKGVQDAIPVRTIWKNGIFLVGNNKYKLRHGKRRGQENNVSCL